MNKSFQSYKLHAGTYDLNYYILIGNDYEKIIKFIQERQNDSVFTYNFTECLGACFTRFNYRPIIWFPHKPETPRQWGTFAHECLHLVNYILDQWAGIKLSVGSEEAYTHLLCKIVTDILKKFK